jgi:hypothetical protein
MPGWALPLPQRPLTQGNTAGTPPGDTSVHARSLVLPRFAHGTLVVAATRAPACSRLPRATDAPESLTVPRADCLDGSGGARRSMCGGFLPSLGYAALMGRSRVSAGLGATSLRSLRLLRTSIDHAEPAAAQVLCALIEEVSTASKRLGGLVRRQP